MRIWPFAATLKMAKKVNFFLVDDCGKLFPFNLHGNEVEDKIQHLNYHMGYRVEITDKGNNQGHLYIDSFGAQSTIVPM